MSGGLAMKDAGQSGGHYSIGPLTRLVALADFEWWLAKTKPGDVLPYADGPCLPAPKSDATMDAVRDAVAAGAISMMPNKRVDGALHYFVKRLPEHGVPAGAGTKQTALQTLEQEHPLAFDVLRLCRRHVTFHSGFLPSNAAIGTTLGVKGEQVRYALKTLEKGKFIDVFLPHNKTVKRRVSVLLMGNKK